MTGLTIDGRPLPLDGSHPLKLDYRAADLADVQSGRTAPKLSIDIPSTPEADRLFGNADNPLTANRFNDSEHRVEVTSDGVTLFCGTAFLAAATRNANGSTTYTLTVKSDTALWARSAALRRLSDASLHFSGRLNPDDICAGWSDNRPVKFFPVNRTNRTMGGSSTSLLPAQSIMTTDDYRPFISAAALVEAIFADAGYSVESAFMQTDLFRSLYISGSYKSVDASANRRKMDFLAGRTSDVSAKADYFGRVYMTVASGTSSVGNIVDTAESYLTDQSGAIVKSGFFSTNDCFYVDEESGVATFRPTNEAVIGFQYSLAYITDHYVLSRNELKGFNSVYLGNGTKIPFTLANRYVDNRSKPLPGYSYKVFIFDHDSSYVYRVTGVVDGTTTVLAEIDSRTAKLTMPMAGSISSLTLLRSERNANLFRQCTTDWALYWGFVEERGTTEVEISLCSPAEHLSPQSVKRFNEIFIDGAEPGMNFTLLKRTTVRPLFSTTAGYNSQLTFRDVAATDIRQTDLLEALQQMFDLRFCTDEPSKKVFIEPYADFFSGSTVDWSDRIDRDSPIIISDPSATLHEQLTLGYADDDGFVTRFNNRTGQHFGRWSFTPASQAALDGEQMLLNPLFSPTISENGKYYEAQSACIMQVRDTDEDSGDEPASNFSPRIVRYCGVRPLAQGEMWGAPYSKQMYPLAAFHFAGDERTDGFTLCFEDRDGHQGLHKFHERRLREQAEGLMLTLSLRLKPDEVASLTCCREGSASVRSLFRLDVDGRSSGALYSLRSIEGYDPSKPTVRCTFIKWLPQ